MRVCVCVCAQNPQTHPTCVASAASSRWPIFSLAAEAQAWSSTARKKTRVLLSFNFFGHSRSTAMVTHGTLLGGSM